MFDIFSDILSALSKNKLRTALTGLSMAWGIFMLVALLGCGNGLMNAMLLNFRNKTNNIAYLWPGRTTMPSHGLQGGRKIIIDDACLKGLKKKIPEGVFVRAGYYGSTQYSGENPSFFTQLGINGQLAVGATILEFYKGNPLY